MLIKIEALPIRANFSGNVLTLRETSDVKSFIKNPSIFKINGHQGIVLNIKKNPTSDILTARESVLEEIAKIKQIYQKQGINITLMDDESTDVRNRLSLFFRMERLVLFLS